MNRKTLKDRSFNIIGYYEIDSSGRKVLKDRNFNILGYYDPRADRTMDYRFNIIGYGDILAILLR